MRKTLLTAMTVILTRIFEPKGDFPGQVNLLRFFLSRRLLLGSWPFAGFRAVDRSGGRWRAGLHGLGGSVLFCWSQRPPLRGLW